MFYNNNIIRLVYSYVFFAKMPTQNMPDETQWFVYFVLGFVEYLKHRNLTKKLKIQVQISKLCNILLK